jgi:hypothetical protein
LTPLVCPEGESPLQKKRGAGDQGRASLKLGTR